MAAFRVGKFSDAEVLLTEAVKSPIHENQRQLALAFRALARMDSGRENDARSDLGDLARLNLTLPEPPRMSAVVRDQDQLAVRLAYQEAKSRASGPRAAGASDRR